MKAITAWSVFIKRRCFMIVMSTLSTSLASAAANLVHGGAFVSMGSGKYSI